MYGWMPHQSPIDFDHRGLNVEFKSTSRCDFIGPLGAVCEAPSVLGRVPNQESPHRCAEHRSAISYRYECEYTMEPGIDCGRPATEWDLIPDDWDDEAQGTVFRCDEHAELEGLVGEDASL